MDSQQKKFYTILNGAVIRERMKEDICRVSDVLSFSKASACVLLIHFKWNEEKLYDYWFENEGNAREAVGLLVNPNEIPDVQQEDNYFSNMWPSVSVIPNNFKKSNETSEESVITCLECPKTGPPNTMTAAACGHYFCSACWQARIGTLLSVDPGCLIIRCLEPSCACTIGQDIINKLAKDKDKEKYEQNVIRSYIEENKKIQWCPIGCGFAVELSEDTENYDVICSCSARFCWKCLMEPHEPVDCDMAQSWILDNVDKSGNINGVLVDSQPDPVQKALDYLQYLQDKKLDELSEKLEEPITELDFIPKAWLQIADCRRVLKWISVYKNCLPHHESLKRDFLQHLQDNAESYLKHLHRLAEKELQGYLNAESPVRGFKDYRAELKHSTSFTRGHFEELVRHIKTHFKEVVSADCYAEHGQSSNSNVPGEASTEIKVATSGGQHCSLCQWTCNVCTYAGNPSSLDRCTICDHYR